MRFLADESCDFAVVRSLRRAGHRVTAVAEISPRAPDERVMALARRTRSLLLTEDKDFGQLVFSQGRRSAGVMLIRYPARARSELPKAVLSLIRKRGSSLRGKFTVLQPGRARIRPERT
jgi:predicted nuclease of predicted toxin-antitoxin system